MTPEPKAPASDLDAAVAEAVEKVARRLIEERDAALAALSSQAAVMEAMAKALEASTTALAHVDSSLTAMADGGHAPASGTWGFVLRRIDANRTALSQYRTLGDRHDD